MIYKSINGLHNFGNSCYFNACIQLLKPVYEHLDDADDFYSFYYDYNNLKNKYLSICHKLKSSGNAEDASETILILIDELNTKYKNVCSLKYNRLNKCNNCNNFKIYNEDSYEINTILMSSELNYKNENDIIKFDKVLSNMLTKEHIDNDNIINNFKKEFINCNCNKNYLLTQLVLIDMPKYLFINVGRYRFVDQNITIKNKCNLLIYNKFQISTPISLKEKLLNNNNNNNNIYHKYRLIGLILHLGNNSNNGHYITIINNNNKWYYCDDMIINEINIFDLNDELIKKNSYLLLYIKF
jgi:ubiquitin C-terminal hydrolase